MEVRLLENERIDDLQLNGLKIIQNKRKFCFGMDAVLLAHFAGGRKGDRVVDLETGTGVIPILLSGISRVAHVYGVEIQPDMAEMARRSVMLNHLEHRIDIVVGDIKNISGFLGIGKYDLVVSNPPYKRMGTGILNPYDAQAIARHEILCSLEDILDTAAGLLKYGGRFTMVHRPERMTDILCYMREVGLEPKKIRLVHPRMSKAPNLMLVEGIRGGKPNLKWMPPLFIYDEGGSYTEEVKMIYNSGGRR